MWTTARSTASSSGRRIRSSWKGAGRSAFRTAGCRAWGTSSCCDISPSASPCGKGARHRPSRRLRNRLERRRCETVIPKQARYSHDGPPEPPASANAERPIRGRGDRPTPWPRANPTRAPRAVDGPDPEGRIPPAAGPRGRWRARDPGWASSRRGGPRPRGPDDSRVPDRLFLRHRPALDLARRGSLGRHEGGCDPPRPDRHLFPTQDVAPHRDRSPRGPTDGPRRSEMITAAADSTPIPAVSYAVFCLKKKKKEEQSIHSN